MIVNEYSRQLPLAEIEAGAHRELVGGLWDEMGSLQFEFLRARGLLPGHALADVGCGALRGGLRFIDYLDAGRYHGMDCNASLLEAGRHEIAQAGLEAKAPVLLADAHFALSRFGLRFDCAIAVSVFTHLPMNHIVRCLAETCAVLNAGARFYATFFEAPSDAHLTPLRHPTSGIVTHFDMDPYHYSMGEIEFLAREAGVEAERIGDWGHPRDQRMWVFGQAAER